MIVTINTDAAYHTRHKIGAYAFWIVSDAGRIMMSGAFNKKAKSSDEAEMQCIINALYVLQKQNWPDIGLIIINTDSMNSIFVFTNNKVEINKYGLHWAESLRHKFNKIKVSCRLPKNSKIKFAHVKAHTDNTSKRSWVNQWCDEKAKEQLWKQIKKSPLKP